MLIGRAEKAESGVDKIMEGWRESHWPKPFIQLESQPARVKLTLPMFNVIPGAVLNELNVLFDAVSHYTIDGKVATSERKVDTSNKKVSVWNEDFDSEVVDDVPISTKVATSDRKVDTSKSKVATSRLSKDELEKQIMQVCKDNYIKMEEVAIRTGKSVDYLKNKIFPNMVRGGKLEKRFSYTHNHPGQGYKTANEYVERL